MTIVTLTTDYGTKDYYSARLKGSILSAQAHATIVDVTHEINRFDINHGAIVLVNAYPSFPKGSIHILSVDGTDCRGQDYIFFYQNGHFFVGPNNGIFSIVFPQWTDYIYQPPRMRNTDLNKSISRIISGISRDVPLDQLGKKMTRKDVVRRMRLEPVMNNNIIRGTIIHVDHFGNLFLNILKDQFEQLSRQRSFRLYYRSGDPITELHQHYHDVPIGDVMCRFNEGDYLEIGVHMGQANEELGLGVDDTIQIEFDN